MCSVERGSAVISKVAMHGGHFHMQGGHGSPAGFRCALKGPVFGKQSPISLVCDHHLITVYFKEPGK